MSSRLCHESWAPFPMACHPPYFQVQRSLRLALADVLWPGTSLSSRLENGVLAFSVPCIHIIYFASLWGET